MKHKLLNTASALICGLFLLVSSTANATSPDVVVSMQIDNPIMEINGIDTEIDQGRGTAPIILNGRTLVPIRSIVEAFDGTVTWDEADRAVILVMNYDTVKLYIDNHNAYLNSVNHKLDVAPAIINGRTLLPIRFVAESFNLGVAWDDSSKTISVIRNLFDDSEYERLMRELPEYSGNPYAFINENKPYFKEYEIVHGSFEYYSSLDKSGRCDVCMASVSPDTMPTNDRESISDVTPTGWKNQSYNNISGGYLYNRCHLIGFQLTGENANERNLITGTRYMNVEGMLPFENAIDDYVDRTGNHVLYRSTPVFSGDNLLADGVLLEAYSVEDFGKGISFCVFCYNVQPNITINYRTGDNYQSGQYPPTQEPPGIFRTPSGKKYHFDPQCGGKNSYEITLEEAVSHGLTPCQKCSM